MTDESSSVHPIASHRPGLPLLLQVMIMRLAGSQVSAAAASGRLARWHEHMAGFQMACDARLIDWPPVAAFQHDSCPR